MNVVENDVRALVDKELAAANERFPQFHSQHEGYAVIREEIEETREQLDAVDRHLNYLWDRVKCDCAAREQVEYMKRFAINAACEAIQVAAMAQKFLEMEKDHG